MVSFRSWIRRWSIRSALTLIVVASACGSQHPTAPRIATPPAAPLTPPPTPQVDWDGLARLFRDPLFESLPQKLEDQTAAQALNAAVTELDTAIRIRNYDMLLDALGRIAEERAAYLDCSCYNQRELPLLLAISLFQMRARAYLNGAEVRIDAAPIGG